MIASGTFSVEFSPIDLAHSGNDQVQLGAMEIVKQYSGDLTGEATGTMLSALTEVEGSAGYVAIEQFTGSLGELEGGFTLQHFGTVDNGEERLLLEIVPDSGTEELTGIRGEMSITKKRGLHFYEFEYVVENDEQ